MQQIQLSLSLDEVNVLLESLGDQPYAKVHQIIANIHQQAQMQIQNEEQPPPDSVAPGPNGAAAE